MRYWDSKRKRLQANDGFANLRPRCTCEWLVDSANLVHAASVRWRPPRPVAARAAFPIPRRDGSDPRISFGPRIEVVGVLRAHDVVAVVVTHIRSIWVVVHVGSKAPWNQQCFLRGSQIGKNVCFVKFSRVHVDPSCHGPRHVVNVGGEPIHS